VVAQQRIMKQQQMLQWVLKQTPEDLAKIQDPVILVKVWPLATRVPKQHRTHAAMHTAEFWPSCLAHSTVNESAGMCRRR
jgi:hypothetical protein